MEPDICFFCEKIIIPNKLILIDDVKKYFEEKLKIEFTLDYTVMPQKIGNKFICNRCLMSLKNIIFVNNKKNDGNFEDEDF